MPHVGDVVIDQPAVRGHRPHHRFGRVQRRDDERHAAFGADGQIALPARVAGVDDQVHAVGRHLVVRMGAAFGGQPVFNARDPVLQLFLRTSVQGGKGADDAGRALRHDQLGPRDQKHGGADDRQAGLGA